MHPIKAAGTAALCWVFSIVQRKDRLSPQGFPAGWHRQAAGEAGTKCCPRERGHYGHCTGWEQVSGICARISYFICTYRSSFQGEYYPPWEPPVSRFRATRKWYFPPSEPPQHIVAAHIFDFTINLLIVILGELLMQYHQIRVVSETQ